MQKSCQAPNVLHFQVTSRCPFMLLEAAGQRDQSKPPKLSSDAVLKWIHIFQRHRFMLLLCQHHSSKEMFFFQSNLQASFSVSLLNNSQVFSFLFFSFLFFSLSFKASKALGLSLAVGAPQAFGRCPLRPWAPTFRCADAPSAVEETEKIFSVYNELNWLQLTYNVYNVYNVYIAFTTRFELY